MAMLMLATKSLCQQSLLFHRGDFYVINFHDFGDLNEIFIWYLCLDNQTSSRFTASPLDLVPQFLKVDQFARDALYTAQWICL